MTQPRFFIIGAAKSGTTSFAQYLDQHPQLFCCRPKEPNFYAFPENETPCCRGPASSEILYDRLLRYSVTDREAYERLFAEAPTECQVGDASVRYLYVPDAAARIAKDHPDARLLVLLRDPIDRMHSHFHMNVQRQLEPLSFSRALAEEDERVRTGWGWDWHYRRVGHYAEQLERYLKHFRSDQIFVAFHGDFQERPQKVLQQAFVFLGVDETFQPDLSQKSLVGVTPKYRWLRQLIREDNVVKRLAQKLVPQRLRRTVSEGVDTVNRGRLPPIPGATRQAWRKRFLAADQRLSELLGRPIPWK